MAATTDAASNLHITSQIFLVGMRLNRAAPSVEITCVRTLLLVHSWIEVVRKKKKKKHFWIASMLQHLSFEHYWDG